MRRPSLLAAFALGFGLGLVGLAPPAAAQTAAATMPQLALPYADFTLPNGLRVLLHVDRRTPVVAVNVWYHVGSKDEVAGKTGFAHLFEHLMFQGSRNVGEDQFFKYLERAGASERNGTTNTDRTNYFETVPSNQLELALWLESDRMGFLLDHVDQKTFDSQRDVVKNERRQSYENAPYGLVPQVLAEAMYPSGHPYHHLTIGTPEDLDRATLDDVRAFFRTYYVPNNATLVLAGDFDEAKTRALVERYFGGLAQGAAPPRREAPAPVTLSGEKRLSIEADVELARLYVAWPTPALYAPGDAELDVVSELLTGGKTARLAKRLVYDLELAQDVSAMQRSSALGSQFQITVTLRKDKKPEEALRLVDEELARLLREGVSEVEVGRSRTSILSELIFRTESVTARADALNGYARFAGDPGFIDDDFARYAKVTPDAARRAAETYLPPARRVVAIVTPTAGAPRAGRLAGSQ
jgi:zinc protease